MPSTGFDVSDADRVILESWTRSSTVSAGRVERARIVLSVAGWNDRCHPFTWTKTADEILRHATRQRDSDARH